MIDFTFADAFILDAFVCWFEGQLAMFSSSAILKKLNDLLVMLVSSFTNIGAAFIIISSGKTANHFSKKIVNTAQGSKCLCQYLAHWIMMYMLACVCLCSCVNECKMVVLCSLYLTNSIMRLFSTNIRL